MKKLTPLQVPWMVSPSLPGMKLVSDDDGDATLQLVALFGGEPELESVRGVDASMAGASVGVGMRGVTLDPSNKSGRYQLVKLTFKNAGWVCRSPQHSDLEVVDEGTFDWSAIGGRIRSAEQVHEWRNRCLLAWRSTKIAPDPGAYIVSNSDWHSQEAERWGLKHYLILGDTSYVEVLAQDIEWESEGALIGW